MYQSKYYNGGPEQEPRDDKLGALIMYISRESQGDPNFGATKLNKILFFADMLNFQRYGESITGQVYQKLDHGPAPVRLVPVQSSLEARGLVTIVERASGPRIRKVTVPREEPNLELFSGREIDSTLSAIRLLSDMNNTQASEYSHSLPAWKLVGMGEAIPYTLFLVDDSDFSSEDIEFGVELARERQAKKNTQM